MNKLVGWNFILCFDLSVDLLWLSFARSLYLCQMPKTCQPYLYSLVLCACSRLKTSKFSLHVFHQMVSDQSTESNDFYAMNFFSVSFLPIECIIFTAFARYRILYFFLLFILMLLHSSLLLHVRSNFPFFSEWIFGIVSSLSMTFVDNNFYWFICESVKVLWTESTDKNKIIYLLFLLFFFYILIIKLSLFWWQDRNSRVATKSTKTMYV